MLTIERVALEMSESGEGRVKDGRVRGRSGPFIGVFYSRKQLHNLRTHAKVRLPFCPFFLKSTVFLPYSSRPSLSLSVRGASASQGVALIL